MVIKDRVATDDNRFIMKVSGDDTPKIVTLSRAPSEVLEEGTPINKDLLQPLVDSLDVVDISNDFIQVVQQEDFADSVVVDVRKSSNVISGTVIISNTSGIGLLERFGLKINSKYVPASSCFIPALTVKQGTKMFEVGEVFLHIKPQSTDIGIEIRDTLTVFQTIQFSFTYIAQRS